MRYYRKVYKGPSAKEIQKNALQNKRRKRGQCLFCGTTLKGPTMIRERFLDRRWCPRCAPVTKESNDRQNKRWMRDTLRSARFYARRRPRRRRR